MKKIITFILTALLMTVSVYADGFAVESDRAVNAAAPFDKKQVSILWSTSEAETAGSPVVCGEQQEYVLMPVSNKISKLTSAKGELTAFCELSEKVSENIRGAIDGTTLIQPARTSVYAINTEDMSIICSRTFGEITTDCAVRNNLAYFGYKHADGGYRFVCADISKGLEPVWEYSSDKALTAPSSYGEFIVFSSGEKLIIRTADGEFIENRVGAEITSVMAGKYAVFMACSDNTVKKLRLENSGKMEADSLMSCKVGSELTDMAEYNNRVYVGSADGFFILDGLNMEIDKAYNALKNSAAPLVCYGNGQRVFTVSWSEQEQRDILYSILDNESGQTLSEVIKIIDFTDGYFTASQNGVMYFRTADGKLWAIAQKEINYVVIALKVFLTLAVFAMGYIILRGWLKKHGKDKSPFLRGQQ